MVGLGNPGKEYELTRHNVGFMVVDKLKERYNGQAEDQTPLYTSSSIQIHEHPILLVKPLTYMNNSGQAVKKIVQEYQLAEFSHLLVIADDLNLPFGTIRLRPSGSDGGHKGLRSIIQYLQSEDFPRLRIGIGNNVRDTVEYVLSPFTKYEQKYLDDILDWAADAVESFVVHGIEKTMSRYNKHVLNLSEED